MIDDIADKIDGKTSIEAEVRINGSPVVNPYKPSTHALLQNPNLLARRGLVPKAADTDYSLNLTSAATATRKQNQLSPGRN